MIPEVVSRTVIVESFLAGRTGEVRLRPIAEQRFPSELLVEGNKSLIRDYPVGTRFKVLVSLRDRQGGGQFLYSSWQWDVVVIPPTEEAA